MAHRLGALVFTIAVSGLLAVAWRQKAPGSRTLALGLLVLLMTQIVWGVGSVTSSFAAVIVVPHFAVGLRLFAVLALSDFWLGYGAAG